MAWFKVDDKFPRHRKVRAARRTHPTKTRDVAPFGLWVLAGAESDDGFIALEVLLDWDDEAKGLAERLVAAGLWHPVIRDGEQGFEFHDWADQNPADPSTSGSFGNHVRWHKKRGQADPECPHCEAESSGRYRGEHRGDIGGESPPESLPARPGPTRPDPVTTSRKRSAATETPARFDEFWNTYDHKVGRKKAEAAYRSALKKPGVTDDLLIAAAGAYVAAIKAEGKHPTFTKHPTTWLNGEHWGDERTPRQQPLSRVQQHLQLARDLAAEQTYQPREIGDGR